MLLLNFSDSSPQLRAIRNSIPLFVCKLVGYSCCYFICSSVRMHCVTSPFLFDLSTQSDKFGTKKYLFFLI